jgi:hypothetical protein
MTAIPAEDRTPERIRVRTWCALAVFLLAWNGLAASHSNPMTLLQGYDGPQYHLLARNRLQGHYEIADTTHTVRLEGGHPMWRPGLVWMIEALARVIGSVSLAAALASALGTTLMELALLWLARRCFGLPTFVGALLCIVAPLSVSTHMLRLAIGSGPEPWATAFILVGLAALVEAIRRGSWRWAACAGLAAGLSEWFRTGNLIMFGIPCAVYALAALARRERARFAFPVLAVACFMGISSVGGRLVPSPVDKTTANLWGNLVETQGPQLTKTVPIYGAIKFHMGGLTLAPGTTETYYDHIVRRSQNLKARTFFLERSEEFVPLYFERLGKVASTFAWGLRLHTGEVLLVLFLFQLIVSLVRRRGDDIHVLALGGGAVAFFLGPVVLLRGDEPTQYLLVMVPLMIPVAARGAIEVGHCMFAVMKTWRPALAEALLKNRPNLLAVAAAPALCLSISFYMGAISYIESYERDSAAENAKLDALHLEGRTVACRNMSWFVDRDVQTVLFPFATLPELEAYVRANKVDGILIWENEPSLFFYATPYGSIEKLDEAMRASRVFDSVQVSGAWRWYPVHAPLLSRRGP